jgi:hypothetical protein
VLAPRRLDPPWLVLGLATLAAYLLAWVARFAWTLSPLTVAGRSSPYVDRPYHVALITELRHHFPPELSFVDGQPLHYHWFVHAHIAATSWLTGIDTMVLLTRLWMVPVLALTVFGTGLLTVRLTGHAWTGVAASALLVLVGDFDPFGWSRTANFVDERFLTPVIDLSPTHTFATALLLLVVGLMCAALTDGARSPGTWVALTVSMLGLSGAKATFVPMLLAGCLAVIGVRALRRTWRRRTGGLLLVTVAVLAFAQLVIFGAESQGMAVDPGHLARAAASHAGLGPTTVGTLLTVGAALVAWLLVPGAGVVGLLVSGRWRDDRAVLLAGIVVSGVLAAMTFGHSHYGEAYFARSTAVPTAVLSAWGLGLLVGYADRRRWGVLGGAVVAGAVVLGVVESFTGRAPGTG